MAHNGLYAMDKVIALYYDWLNEHIEPEFKELSLAVHRATNMTAGNADGLCRNFMQGDSIEFGLLMIAMQTYNDMKTKERLFMAEFVIPLSTFPLTAN